MMARMKNFASTSFLGGVVFKRTVALAFQPSEGQSACRMLLFRL